MNSNDTTTTPRYSVWTTATEATVYDACQLTWADAYTEFARLIGNSPHNKWRIWDHSTTPPSDVTDADPEGAHPPTAPLIPNGVHEITIKRRYVYGECDDDLFYATIKGDGWTMTTSVRNAEVLTRLHEIAAAMEAVK